MYKINTKKMRNQPNPETGKVDIIDRHSKKRLIVVDGKLLLTQISQDYMMLLIDLAEISDYFDVLVVGKESEMEILKEFLDHWMLKAEVKVAFQDYKEILQQYRIMFCFTTMRSRDKFREYYRVDCFSR